jgi:hypothetical protein
MEENFNDERGFEDFSDSPNSNDEVKGSKIKNLIKKTIYNKKTRSIGKI